MLPTVKKQEHYGLREREKTYTHDLHTPNQVPSTRPKKTENEDNNMYTFTPFGLPKMTAGTTNRLHYNWEKSKGQEYNLRDPVMKPNAVPVDDEYLGVLPPETAHIAWQHMKSNKKRPSLDDFINTPEPPPVQVNAMTTETDDDELSETELTPIPQEERADKPDSETEFKDGEVENRSGGITSVHNVATGDFTDPTEIPDSILAGLKELNAPSPPRIPSFTSVETVESEPDLESTMISTETRPFSLVSISIPEESLPKRRTLVERTEDYRRRLCRPIKTTPIHPLLCSGSEIDCDESRTEPSTCSAWSCASSAYHKKLSRCNPFNGNRHESQQLYSISWDCQMLCPQERATKTSCQPRDITCSSSFDRQLQEQLEDSSGVVSITFRPVICVYARQTDESNNSSSHKEPPK